MESPGLVSPNLVTFFFTLINIGILFVILRAILFKPVTKFMDDRAKKIQDTIDQAEKDKAQAKMLLHQYEEQLKKAGEEAEVLIRAARENAREEADRITAGGKAEADTLLANARKQIEAEQQAALARFRTEAAALVVSASARLIRRELNQEDNRRYAGMLLREIGNT
ncbi:MAG: F0F1 ATP synthase subunit B [Spirochaetaceae bacterium]|jgi:F-type H+-transporting ATPase subunit b|nr:F0F1 ATP synthase subunit B [Spirochaetaceae bacterium]